MIKKDIEQFTNLDMKGLIMNPEIEASFRTIANEYLILTDELSKTNKNKDEVHFIVLDIMGVMLKGGQS